jgi:hypothetical protein
VGYTATSPLSLHRRELTYGLAICIFFQHSCVVAGRRLLVVIISCSTSACTRHKKRFLNNDQRKKTKRSFTHRGLAHVVMLVTPAACEEAQCRSLGWWGRTQRWSQPRCSCSSSQGSGHDVQFDIVHCSSRHEGKDGPLAPRTTRVRAYLHGPGVRR